MRRLWNLQFTLFLLCVSVLNTAGIKQRPIGSIRRWDPEAAYLTRCDFNNNSRPFCDWTQPCTVNQGLWIRTKHDTPTDGTGPEGDYPDGEGYFIYQEASNLIPFDINRLESPETLVSEQICIDFWYYMFGSEDMNELRVRIQDSTGESVVWSRKGNQSSSWIYGAITQNFPTPRKIKVIFEAVRGLTEYGDTALDNVRVRNGPCEAVPTPVPPEPTPPPVTEAVCSVHGDPHYHTFDNQRHDFMGTCTYTLSKLCEGNGSLPYFNVEAANEHRGSNTRVSYVRYVDIDVYGYRINLGQKKVVKVDGVSQVLPVTLAQGVNISISGQYVVVTTDFGLNVKFDGNHRVEITLPSTYMSKVCGICGNYNGHKADDFLNPDGEMEENSAGLGNSWQVYNDSRCLPDAGHTPNCTADEKLMIQSNEYCGLITDPSGPFQNCHSVVNPQSYSEACQYDLCELHLDNAALCENLQAYADVCQAAGVQLTPWRNATFCPLTCAANSHYEPCAAACPATCADPMAPYNCRLPCVEGCVCDSGYLLYNDRCVPSQQCGCWHKGQHYPVGSEFWTDNTCSSRCKCPARGSQVQCSSASCPEGQYCGVQDGQPQCLQESYGICHVHGDPHYNTFDKLTHNFMGNCTYTLATVCSNISSLPYFNVEAKNEHRGSPRVSYVREVLVEVYGERIRMVKKEKSQVLVNNVRQTLPVSAAGGALTVSRSGRYIVLETDFKLQVSYDTDHSVEVKVPTTYFNLTCGMCGNFNNRKEDDYMMPNGQQAPDSNALGESWQVADDDPSCGVPVPIPPCSSEKEELYQSEQFCGMLTASPGAFERCHGVINPQSYFETCSYDLCALDGGQEFLCAALEAYADACQAAGVTLAPWRNATFCPIMCPPNSHYNPCTSACPATCTEPLASENCSKPCVEGCECNNGFVISGEQCVSTSNCGCLQNGKYYEKGEAFWQAGCAGRCICNGNGSVVCNSDRCKASEVCKVQNGLLGCYPLNPSTCHIFGDPHYVTFDGRLYHFQGDCNYTAVETCTNSSEKFSITTRNEHRGNPNWTALNSVAITLEDLHIVLKKKKETYVNGVQVSLPVALNHGARVDKKGQYVVIDTSKGIQVKFDGDQELFILADESLKGQLCGLCGTFNDNQLDDFLTPDKVLQQDPNKFGDSWLVKDDSWVCNPVAVVPPTCDTAEEKEYEELCKVILKNSGPFQACHWHVPPQAYFESCVYDLCATEGNSEQYCKILEAYAAACELEGVNLGDWRKDTICGTPTSCNMTCSFDVSFCAWEQGKSDSLDWIRHKGPTPTPNTGPSYDHTTGEGYYIYLQGSNAQPGFVGQLVSPVCGSEGPHCFRFWYHMHGTAVTMGLRVYVVEDDDLVLVWERTGAHGDQWHLGEVTVQGTGDMQIILEGEWGEDIRSDVALDDLSIERGSCAGDVTPTTPSTTTPSGTTPVPRPDSGTCVVEGDPHYHTFDNQLHNFMGTCTYTLSKLCESDSSLPYFNVEAANEHRGGNTRVSYVRYVDVDVYGQRIRLGKAGVVTVNGVPEILPCFPSAGVQVMFSGFYTVVTTDFGLRVKFDGNHRVEVTLPSTFGQKVCGMCGNYNGMTADDFLNPEGELEPDSTSLGNSWQVSNDSSCSAGPLPTPACNETDKQAIASSHFCGLLTDTSGPFKQCHAVLSPSAYFDTCSYDLCELGLDHEVLCKSLQSYVDACMSLGIKIPVWRNATFCPITCPANSHYEPCAAACPATCADPMAPASCKLPCVEGCVCDSGYLLYNDHCVPSQQCGCWHKGQHYPVGSEFWTDNTCSSRCKCPARGSQVQCSSASCPEGQYCGVQDGQPQCLQESYGICHVHGDPHYNTFDKLTHNFMGNCTYTLATVCSNTSSLPYFNVEAKNEHRGSPRVSYVREVLVEVYGERIRMVKKEKSQVLVNNVRQTLPVSAAGGALTVSRSGRYIVLETDFKLQVSYDTDHSVEVKVPTTYFNLTCGMCGNFNNRKEDDYMMPNGQQAPDSNALGESWQVADDDPSCSVPVPIPPCSSEKEELYQSEQFCGMLTASPGAFERCHGVINPQSYFETCSYDLCALDGGQEFLCAALEAYADACQAAGVTLAPWRNATFCPLPCPANSYYDPCMTSCPATCADREAPQSCSKPCMEGCACTSGFLLSGDTCVPEARCGCLFEGNYYSEGEYSVSENCSRQCRCAANGQMVCSALSCAEDEVCKIQNGQRGCYPASTAVCHIYGDPHYSTFDGKLHHFQGSCNYTVVTGCDSSSVGFSLTTRNEHRGSRSWTALNSVALSMEGLHIALLKNKAVYINGAPALLPVSPAPGVTISLNGSYVQVSTKLGLQLQFNGDQELLVKVSEKHKGKLCGLCGTYTGSQQDDFMRPDGVVVPDFNEFGASWMVPDDEWLCDPAIIPPASCSPSEEEAANRQCAILTQLSGPFQPCHAVLSPKPYFESCVYDQCGTEGSMEQLCNDLGAYVAACAEAGVALGDWSAGTVCGLSTPRPTVPLTTTTMQPSSTPSTPTPTVPSTTSTTQPPSTPSTPTPTVPSTTTTTQHPSTPSTPTPTVPSTTTTAQPPSTPSTPTPTVPSTTTPTQPPSTPSTPTPTVPSTTTTTQPPSTPSTPTATVPSTTTPTQHPSTPSTPTPTVTSTTTTAQPPSTPSTPRPTPSSAPSTDCNFTCAFENDFCAWTQSDSNSINWIRNKGPTPTPDTGPSSDHTMGVGYYIYLQGSEALPGFVGQLVSPVCGSEGPHCFRFWYHMHGTAVTMGLRVYVVKDDNLALVWERTGAHGDQWHLGEVTVQGTGDMQIILEGEWGEDIRSDVALDDLSIERGSCAGLSTPRPTLPTTSTTTRLPSTPSTPTPTVPSTTTPTQPPSTPSTPTPTVLSTTTPTQHPNTPSTPTPTVPSTTTTTQPPSTPSTPTPTVPSTTTPTRPPSTPSTPTPTVPSTTTPTQPPSTPSTPTPTVPSTTTPTQPSSTPSTPTPTVPSTTTPAQHPSTPSTPTPTVTSTTTTAQPPSTPSTPRPTPSSAPSTDCNFTCAFENDFCAWTQSDSNSINWIRNKGPTPTPDTGPSSDHTMGVGYYIYLQGSEALPGFVGQLVSPVCGSEGPHCFRFWYHMHGTAVTMGLRVYVVEDDDLVLVWERTGAHGDQWHLGEVTVQGTGDMQIILEGEWGEDIRSDVALDDLSIERGSCAGLSTPRPTLPTTSTTTRLPSTPSTPTPTVPSTTTPTQPPSTPSTPTPTVPSTTTPTQPPSTPSTPTPTVLSTTTPTQPPNTPSTPTPTVPSTTTPTRPPSTPSTPTPTVHSTTTTTQSPSTPSTPRPTPTSGPSTPTPTVPSTSTTTKPPLIPSTPRPTPSSGRASCSASGDPHYNTFDHRVHNFMGNCTYTLSKVCNASERVPYFDVSTTNEHRGANTRVSYVKSVQVEVYGNQISLLKNKKVNVNGRRVNLPVFIEEKISIQSSGGYVLVETDFGLWVRYDGNHYAEVSVPSNYSGLLCGLCGNYNGDPNDDNIKPNGDIASGSNDLGESWLVPDNNTWCSTGTEEKCDPVLENEAKKNTACGMITDPTGIFKDCHAKVPPENFFENCVYDMCFTDGQATSLCYGLQAYAESCVSAGICIEWRNSTLCPMSCPGGSIYKSCGTRCPSTCVDISAPDSCSSLPVEGCFCKEGYVLSGDKCVPESSCGCVDNKNHYHQLNESWFTGDHCNERCTCHANNIIECTSWECGVREECSIKDGVLGCHSNGQAICQVAGDPHYLTFDGRMYTFMGTCTYTLVEVVNTNSATPITILGKNEDRGLRGATYLKEVYIDVYGIRITLQKNQGILLNGERANTPLENRVRGVSVGSVGRFIVVETDFGVIVKFDGNHHLEITLPQSYYSKVQGMCGNFNDNREDELLLPNGTLVGVTDFGNSWKVEADSDEGCLSDTREDDVPPCIAANKPDIERQCNVLKSDKFKACHHLVNPEDFIQMCIYDMCLYDGMKSALCDIVQVYVDTCRNHGITIKWRNSTFCPLSCPPHYHYTDCVSACPSTCNDIFASSLCEKTEECTEGCECDDNYVLSNGKCVPLSSCGCRDDDNNYYSAGEIWITPHCTRRCECQKNGVIKCTSYGCYSGETCVIKNGRNKCNPTGFGKCQILGDPHYTTFDGLVHHFQGRYTYIMAQTIPGLPDTLTPFRIEGMNYPFRLRPHLTYLREVLIDVYNHTVRFMQNKKIVVDGVKVRPPAHPHEGIRIYQRTTRIYLETDFGLYLSFDGSQNADIKLANTYRSRVEGLCGDFDGKPKNDFKNPNGVVYRSVNMFGASWKVPLNRNPARLRRDVNTDQEFEEELDTGLFQGCDEKELEQQNGTSRCEILMDSKGPFANCHSTVSPAFYFTSCLFDMCAIGADDATLCRSLEEYVLTCQQQGVSMGGWRQQTSCGISCPANSNYSLCTSACPASCNDFTSPSQCESPCVEGCECLPGYVLSDSDCVPYKECGCTYLDKYYEMGEIFITDDCSQTCQCTESSTVSCTASGCGPDEICGISNFSRGCYKSGPCMPNPCKNDGVCSEDTNNSSVPFSCECSELYTGPVCADEKIAEDPSTDGGEHSTVAIVLAVVAGVAVIIILIVLAVDLLRNKRHSGRVEIGGASLQRSRDALDGRVHEQDYGYVTNAAFDENES